MTEPPADRRPDLFPPDLPVAETLARHDSGRAWLTQLPRLVQEVTERWELHPEAPFHGGSCSWVAPVRTPHGGSAVLKVTWPHREMAGEAAALRAWAGRGAVRLLAHDAERHALLVERCVPGTELPDAPLPPADALARAADVLAALWDAPRPPDGELETVAAVCAEWADIVTERMDRLRPAYDPGLVSLGAALLRDLPATARREAVVHGDFNPGNILATDRGWLAIDPKPMVGDPGYDLWPLVTQLDDPFEHDDPTAVLRERLALLADALDEPADRTAAWCVARSVESALWTADLGDVTGGAEELAEARVLADVAGL